MEESYYADRSERAKLRFTGPQRAWFLHQVLTQSFEDMTSGEARDAAMITPHGRMVGYLEAIATESAILCHFEPELRYDLRDAIARYVFATRVEIDDVTDEFALVLVVGADSGERATRAAPDGVFHPTRALGVPAAYIWTAPDRRNDVLSSLEGQGLRRASEEQLEAIRIANGVPRWGRDMDEKTLPQEAGIDEVAVHYEKGCYLGQEAMAKIHFRGKVNRRLFRLSADRPLQPGADVLLDDAKVGKVTSASNGTALALLRQTLRAGDKVYAGGAEATVME